MSRQVYFGLVALLICSFSLKGQIDTTYPFDEDYANIGSLEVLNSPARVQLNGKINIPFDEGDSIYKIVVLDSLKSGPIYNYYVIDSTYDELTNESVLKVLYYEKQSFRKLRLGNAYVVSSCNVNPHKWLYEGDTISAISCSTLFSKHYKRDCCDYSEGACKPIKGCIPIRIAYYEVNKIATLP